MGPFVVVGGGIAGVTCAEQVRGSELRPFRTPQAGELEVAVGPLRGSLFRPLPRPSAVRLGGMLREVV